MLLRGLAQKEKGKQKCTRNYNRMVSFKVLPDHNSYFSCYEQKNAMLDLIG
jgi:hypothetical protein